MGSATRFVGGGGGGPDGFLRMDRGCGGCGCGCVDTEAGDSDVWSATFGTLGSDGDSLRWNLEMRRSRRSGVVSASAGRGGSSFEGVETDVVLFLDCAGTLYMAGVGKLTTAAGVVLDRLREESLGGLPAGAWLGTARESDGVLSGKGELPLRGTTISTGIEPSR